MADFVTDKTWVWTTRSPTGSRINRFFYLYGVTSIVINFAKCHGPRRQITVLNDLVIASWKDISEFIEQLHNWQRASQWYMKHHSELRGEFPQVMSAYWLGFIIHCLSFPLLYSAV